MHRVLFFFQVLLLWQRFWIGSTSTSVVAAPTTTVEFHVDPILGRLQNHGRSAQFPFLTLSQAANAIAKFRQQQPPSSDQPLPVTVYIHGNSIAIREPLVLNASHSYSTWKSASSTTNTRARIHGGYRLDIRQFQKIGNHIYKINLPSDVSLGTFQSGIALNECAHDQTNSVIWNGSMLTLARFPNENRTQPQWYRIRNVTSPNSFTYYYDDNNNNTDAADNQKRDTTIRFSNDLWLHGYWNSDWADNYVKVQSITTTTTNNHHDGDEEDIIVHIDTNTSHILYKLSNDARFYVLNSLDLIDTPGEYYLDRTKRQLYIYPPTSFDWDDDDPPEVYISQAAHLIVADNVTHVHLENLHFDISQGSAIIFNHSNHISIINSSITNVGGSWAVLWDNVTHSTIANVHITQLACSGIGLLRSGDRHTLQSSYNRIQHNRIHDYARWKRTYMAGIYYDDACGHVLVGNEIYDAPHQGISGHGNDIIIRSNHLHDLCYETSDGGAMYFGRSFADRGNVIANNHFERIRRTDVYYADHHHHSNKIIIKGYPQVQAIYLDDQMSGFNITGNWIRDSDTGILLGGGRDHFIAQNRFVNVDIPIFWDKRGVINVVNTAFCEPHGAFQTELENYHFQQPPWSIRYPELVSMFQDDPCAPANNVIHDFQFCWSNHSNASSPTPSSWIHASSTSLEELVLWNNSFSKIAQNGSLCNHPHPHIDTSEGSFSLDDKAMEKLVLNNALEIQ